MSTRRFVTCLLLSLTAMTACGSTVSEPESQSAGAIEAELTPVSLPDGWARCEGGSDGRRWVQTFGPQDPDGGCIPVVTMSQLPIDDPGSSMRGGSWQDVKVGDLDGAYRRNKDENRHELLTWAFQQNLLFEASIDAMPKKQLREFAGAAYEGQRQFTPDSCDDERSDLSDEDLVGQLSRASYRLYLEDGCPVKLEIAGLGALPDNDHCWPNLGLGWLNGRQFFKDPGRLLNDATLAGRFDGDASLPATAVDTGLSQADRHLWTDPQDDTVVYVVYEDKVEAWPVDIQVLGCA